MTWTRIGQASELRGPNRYGFYRCHCGTERWIRIATVASGRSVSCGCHRTQQSSERLKARHAEGWTAPNAGRPKGIHSVKVEFRYWNTSQQRWHSWHYYQGMPYILAVQQLAQSNSILSYRIEPRSLRLFENSHGSD